jgi:acyl dehydratase
MRQALMPEQPQALGVAFDSVGRKTTLSEWFEITQEQVDAFAQASGDHQWIHCDTPAASAGPFGGPIAHGLLLLSISLKLVLESRSLPQDSRTWVVYGYDKLRFRAPVRGGKRIRCCTTLLNERELGRRVLITVRFKIEIENERVPALVGDCYFVCLDDRQDNRELENNPQTTPSIVITHPPILQAGRLPAKSSRTENTPRSLALHSQKGRVCNTET